MPNRSMEPSKKTVGTRRNHPVLKHWSTTLYQVGWTLTQSQLIHQIAPPMTRRMVSFKDLLECPTTPRIAGSFPSYRWWVVVRSQESNPIGLGSSGKPQDLLPVDPTCGGGPNLGMNHFVSRALRMRKAASSTPVAREAIR